MRYQFWCGRRALLTDGLVCNIYGLILPYNFYTRICTALKMPPSLFAYRCHKVVEKVRKFGTLTLTAS